MQYHASLITADGAYHCPVGSIMAIFIGVIIAIVVSMPMMMILMPIIVIDQSCDDICAVVMVTSSGRSDHKAPP